MRKTLAAVTGVALALGLGALLAGGAASAQTAAVLQAPAAAQPAGTSAAVGAPQGQGVPVALTLKSAIEMALRNSKDIQVAKLQASVAEHASQVSKAEFLPNLYAGSGAGYTYGIPETPGGRAPSLFNFTYTEQVYNEPLKGQGKELEEQARSQRIVLEDVKNGVILRTAMAYLELGKVRHSLELLRAEQESADKILQVTEERQGEGYELPVEVTKAELTKAQVTQRILQLEGREDELEVFLQGQLGLEQEQAIEVTPEELPGEAEQEGANLVAMAMHNNAGLMLAESDVRAKEFRLKGEKRGNLPTIEAVSTYSLLASFNNYSEFYKKFQRNNFNAGVQVQVPLFSAKTREDIGLAQINLQASQATLASKKTQVGAEVRQKTRHLRERDAAKEVARLELQLAQQNIGVLQTQYTEGKVNLRELERARLDENEKWMAFLDANFQRQQAQLDLLRTAGELDKVWQ
ncbi:MAG TPA: TolC family protein [Verrucomicrobiae bacterium]|jgi:outer membrane protein TolC|nr:TolC family protein [Verrucomicrobiae bacterium]